MKGDQFVPLQVSELIWDILEELCIDYKDEYGLGEEGLEDNPELLSKILRAGDLLQEDGNYEHSEEYNKISAWVDKLYGVEKLSPSITAFEALMSERRGEHSRE